MNFNGRKDTICNSKFKIKNSKLRADATGMTAINIVMPQLGKVLVGKYARATITQLTGIYRLL